jgi:hypothetical protein
VERIAVENKHKSNVKALMPNYSDVPYDEVNKILAILKTAPHCEF